MPEWIRRAPFPASTREGDVRTIDYAARRRRARAPLDGEHGLHRHARLGVARRPAGAARLGDVRPRSLRRRRLRRDGRGGAPRQAGARPGRARRASRRRPGRAASTCSSRSRVVIPSPTRGSSRGSSPRRSRGAHPGLATTEWTKAKRRGVLIDANQNGPGKTTASVYSVRPRAGALVSTPLRWDEVGPSLDPAAFTMERCSIGSRGTATSSPASSRAVSRWRARSGRCRDGLAGWRPRRGR